jgi:dTDP-4-amino-4,6-dideoxygalactose transaminase
MIPFNKPYITGKEVQYIQDAVAIGKISGNGKYTQLCHQYFESRCGFKKTLLTTSCTDALEMCAMLLDIQPGDEVIVPSYTFVSTALAFERQGAKIVFADSRIDHPGVDESKLESLITPATKAIVVVHYAGVACNMDKVMDIAARHKLFVVEDAAHSMDSYYTGKRGEKRALGTSGHLSAFSFHETKNIQCGEGGMLGINDDRFTDRAEVIWEKGTNRAAFFRGETDKYSWVDTGSSFLPSEITAAFLWAQVEAIDEIQQRRLSNWNAYQELLHEKALDFGIQLPVIPPYASNNAHMFYLVCRTPEQQNRLINYLNENGVLAISHYQPLHRSPYYKHRHDGRALSESERYADCLVRLPMYFELDLSWVIQICNQLLKFCDK